MFQGAPESYDHSMPKTSQLQHAQQTPMNWKKFPLAMDKLSVSSRTLVVLLGCVTAFVSHAPFESAVSLAHSSISLMESIKACQSLSFICHMQGTKRNMSTNEMTSRQVDYLWWDWANGAFLPTMRPQNTFKFCEVERTLWLTGSFHVNTHILGFHLTQGLPNWIGST